jgi:hypothetical protein
VRHARGFSIPDSIQAGEHSTASGPEGIPHGTFERKRRVCNADFNDAKRKANLNWFDNEWNDNDWFGFFR